MGWNRVLNIIGAGLSLLVLSPLMLFVAALIRWRLGSPVFFRQMRPGLHGKPFQLIKFRTMRNTVDETGNPLPDAERITRLGQFLRSSSIDELPELWNVLKGEMSLVGPRPLLFEYLSLYTPEQARRHAVRPGITGWAQVNGRNAISWEEKFALDVWYVDNRTIWLDLRILFMTIGRVLCRSGISAAGEATMPAFKGKDVRS
ncbi:sugar transferase [Castellaniella sp.]|uniref:sugar transferase n=1 Tax=Castellaniella sp. TaxID=1955812 RepID=UPI00355F9593